MEAIDKIIMKTPIQKALDYLENQEYDFLDGKTLEFANRVKNKLEELLEMEHQQIIDIVNAVLDDSNMYESFRTIKSGEQYYTTTYNI